MNDKLKKALVLLGEALIELAGEEAAVVPQEKAPEPAAKPEPVKRGRPKKAADPEPEPVDEDDFSDLMDDEEPAPAPQCTELELRQGLLEYAKKFSKDEAYKALEKFGVKRVNELEPSEYGKVLAHLKAEMK